MSVNLVEIAEVPGDLGAIEKSLADAVIVNSAASKAAEGKNDEPSKGSQQEIDAAEAAALPAKLKGKSLAEIAEIYSNLESAYGRMANDLGTQRKLTDRLLDLKRTDDLSREQPAKPVVDRSKLLEDPTAELDRFLTTREATRESETSQRLAQMEASLAQAQFSAKHPDYAAIASAPEFAEWVRGSAFRTRVATAAYQGDWSAADELLSEFKARKAAPAASEKPADKADESGVEAARKAALETAGGSSGGKQDGGGKVYRRSDLMALRVNKPDVYYNDDFQSEILRAYAEGRVK
jgi:hypothetical protein